MCKEQKNIQHKSFENHFSDMPYLKGFKSAFHQLKLTEIFAKMIHFIEKF